MNDTQKMRGRPVTHEEALASAQRLINARPRRPIPVRPDDDDVTVNDYILEQQACRGGVIHVECLPDNTLMTFLRPPYPTWGVAHFGLAVCDIVRHIAKAYRVNENAIWDWAEKERARPTTSLSEVKPS